MSSIYDEILASSDIQTILEYYNLRITKNKCLCPFHKDTHPSMSINKNKGIAKCFVCGAGGNSISFIQKYENEINNNSIDVKEAMKKAIFIQGLNINIPENDYIQLTKEQKTKQRLSNILKEAVIISENNLKTKNIDSVNAIKYLKSRKLSDEIIKYFHIGFDFSIKTLTSELLENFKIDELIDIGITKKIDNGYKDVFERRITIPIFDENGNPVGFGGRVINNILKPKYLNTKETELFNKSNLLFNYHKAKSYAKNDEIIIVEGYMDVISAKAMKMDNVVGTMGVALSKEHINLIKKLNCDITLCLDNDEAGKNAMIRIIPELLKAKLKVNILDISKLGNYKDFGDLQIAGITREQIYETKISAFTFLMKEKYIKGKELNVENISNIYIKMLNDSMIKNSKDVLNFKEYVLQNTRYSENDIESIINPKVLNNKESRIEKYKNIFFYYYVIDKIKSYANRNQNYILLKYIELGMVNSNILMESLNNEKYLKDDELTIDIGSYVREYLEKTDDYIKFKNDKTFILENLLNNAKSFDSKGNIVNIKLNIEQKEIVLQQYKDSFDDNIKEYIENNPDEFEEIFIANSSQQFEKLFPGSYVETIKEQAISRFKNEGIMEAVRYGLAYPDNMKSVMTRQYVNNEKYKTLLVFNNNKNILKLTPENIEQDLKEKDIEKEKENEKIKDSNPMAILIKLSGKEKETTRGMYLPINEETQIYIPKQLYKRNDKEVEILNTQSNQANMSEYLVDLENHKKEWKAKLSLEDFCHKYFNLYEVKMEKEVMV